jgi:uncharacterized protein YraI
MIAKPLHKLSLLALVFVLLFSAAVAVPAVAQDPIALVTTANTVVRGGPGNGFWKVDTLRTNVIVPIIGVSADRAFWQVRTEKTIGFVAAGNVDAKNAGNVGVVTTEPIGTITAASAVLRRGPGTDTARVITLRRGQQFFLIGRSLDGGWLEIRYSPKATGWVLTSTTNQSADSVQGSAQATVGQPRIIVNVSFINVRTGPDDAYSVIGVIRGGTKALILGQNDNGSWLYIDAPVGKGWVNKLNVLTEDFFGPAPIVVSTSNEWVAKVITGAASLRKGPGLAFAKVGTAPARAVVTIIGKSPDGEWWLVRYGKLTGWMSKAVLNAPDQANNVPVVVP